MEKTCKKCGKTMPLEMFPRKGVYRLNKCKDCVNEEKREWRKNHDRSEEIKAKDNLRCALRREKIKSETGKTYRNKAEAERQRAYARKYEAEHKDDPKHKATHRRCLKNYWERKRIREDVERLGEFFSKDFEL